MSLTLHSNLRVFLLAAGVLTVAACPEKENETDSGTGTSEPTTTGPTTEAPTTGGMSTTSETPTTGGTMGGTMTGSTTMMDGSTDTASTSATGGETTTASTSEGTTGALPGELIEACTSACEKFFECVNPPPFPNIEACTGECAGALGEGEMCLEPTVAFNNCIGQMTCDELMAALENEEFGPCSDEFDAMQMSCVACEGFASMGPPDSCSLGQQCGDTVHEFACEGDTCTCLVNGEMQGMCPAADNFCQLTEDQQAALANECCGFEL